MVFFGTIWGIMGAVLAVPLTAVLRIVFADAGDATDCRMAVLAISKGSALKQSDVSWQLSLLYKYYLLALSSRRLILL